MCEVRGGEVRRKRVYGEGVGVRCEGVRLRSYCRRAEVRFTGLLGAVSTVTTLLQQRTILQTDQPILVSSRLFLS